MPEQAGHLSTDVDVDGTRAVVRVEGELDLQGAPVLDDDFRNLVARGVKTVVVDVSAVTFLDSTGLRALVVGREVLSAGGATITLEGVGGVVERVLQMTGLLELLTGPADSANTAQATG